MAPPYRARMFFRSVLALARTILMTWTLSLCAVNKWVPVLLERSLNGPIVLLWNIKQQWLS